MDPIALLARPKGLKVAGKSDAKLGGDKDTGKPSSKGKKLKLAAVDVGREVITSMTAIPQRRKRRGIRECSWRIKYQQCRNFNFTPERPAGSTLLCFTEHEVTYSTISDGMARYYIDMGALIHKWVHTL